VVVAAVLQQAARAVQAAVVLVQALQMELLEL
jgi:hypothetical protein